MKLIEEEIIHVNLVRSYNAPRIRSLDDLGAWFNALTSLHDINVFYVECIDTTERFSEGAETFEYNRKTAKLSLADAIRQKRVDSLAMNVRFRKKNFAIGVDLKDWTVTVVGRKHDGELLDALEAELNKIG